MPLAAHVDKSAAAQTRNGKLSGVVAREANAARQREEEATVAAAASKAKSVADA